MAADAAIDAESSAELRRQLSQCELDVQLLRAELLETNRGVVALYAELDDTAAQLRSAVDLKSRFLSYMSHEFRTPLTSIISMTGILLARMDGPLTGEQVRQLEFVRGSVLELTEMVDDLLELARVEAGRITISPEWFEMVDLFSALRGMFKPIVANSAVSLIFEEPQAIPRIYTDDKKLSQILRNYISNALKFTSEGEVRVVARLSGLDEVEFSVTDTGIGIEAQALAKLFSDFVQIDSRLQRRLRGTGLGLSLARQFAALLGGRVGASSEPGKGSRFWVAIPLQYGGGTASATAEGV
jgi:signal transduction histidine kinase